MKKFLYWTPRILSIVMVCFVSLFAFDVFDQGYSPGELALALFMHLLPSIVAIVIIIIAWKKEQIGGWLFLALAVGLLCIGRFELAAILMISLPIALIGAMFLWHYHKYVKQATGTAPTDTKGGEIPGGAG